MNLEFAGPHGKWLGRNAPVFIRGLVFAAALYAAAASLHAQDPQLQQKLAEVKQSVAQNQQKLQTYSWTETQQITLNGNPKPPKQFLCHYAGGKVVKDPVGPPPAPSGPSGGPLMRHMEEKEAAEMKQYVADIKTTLAYYVPLDPLKMEQAYQAGKLSLNPAGALVNFVFRDYAQPGDTMTLTFDRAHAAVVSFDVNTYMGQAKDAVILHVKMDKLPDGTTYIQQTVLNGTAKQLVVTTTNSNYQKLPG